VSQVPPRTQRKDITQIGKDGVWAVHEVAEARVGRADETPQQTKGEQTGDGVTGPDMDDLQEFAAQPVLQAFEPLALGEPGEAETGDQSPVEETDERIPYRNLAGSSRA
jgi:hypothetical protein